jgi:alpha-tubulin suppressor-like RCC1 family protein/tRNA A-37 threonylcarbamoyl transferase component Bud32
MIDEFDQGEVGDLEDEYELLGEIGRGGSATVYRARDRSLGRLVAIKVVRPKTLASGEDALARLAREARTVAKLQHPNIVTVHAVKRLRDGGLALVMQLVPGRTLKQVIAANGPYTADAAERVLKDIAEALSFAHARGVVHRDVKPENIFIDETTGRALLSDFGIAHSTEFDSRLTMTGAAIGTPAYMSPEQIDGAPANARSDIYSLGLVAWEMLTGQRPWEGEALYNVIFKQKHEELPAIDALRPGAVPARLQYIVERMLQKKPAARWAGADGLLTALNSWVVPSDWKQWEESHRRRREAARSAPRQRATPATVGGAQATVRFQRPGPGDAASQVAVVGTGFAGATASTEPEDATPSWAAPPPSKGGSRFAFGAAAVMLLVGGGMVAFAWQRGYFVGRKPTPVATLVDQPAVELPVLPPVAADSLAGTDSAVVPVSDTSTPPPSGPLPVLADRMSPSNIDLGGRDSGAVRRPRPPVEGGATGGVAGGAAPVTAAAAGAAGALATSTGASGAEVRPTDDIGIVAAGGRHSCVLGGSKVFCWGANDRGQLGDGDLESRDAPGPIVGEIEFVQVAAGLSHSCGVARGGDAYCWGNDDRGQLGDATTTSRSAPVRVVGTHSYRQVRTGLNHSCGLTTAGDVTCWGANGNGQLGDGTTTARTSPVVVNAGVRFVSLSTGWNHTCAVASDGAAYCWGANANGQLGTGTRTDARTPQPVAGGLRFTALAAGSTHSCGVVEGGEAYCWGRNAFGQLGIGGTTDQAVPTRVDTPVRFASVTAGGVHSCGRTRAGQVWCWGRNLYGQLGDGTTVDRDQPVRVVGATVYASVNASGAHTCGTSSDGEVSCWGFNTEGQLGDGTRENNARPTRVRLPGR